MELPQSRKFHCFGPCGGNCPKVKFHCYGPCGRILGNCCKVANFIAVGLVGAFLGIAPKCQISLLWALWGHSWELPQSRKFHCGGPCRGIPGNCLKVANFIAVGLVGAFWGICPKSWAHSGNCPKSQISLLWALWAHSGELPQSRKFHCCGPCGGIPGNCPKVANFIAAGLVGAFLGIAPKSQISLLWALWVHSGELPKSQISLPWAVGAFLGSAPKS